MNAFSTRPTTDGSGYGCIPTASTTPTRINRTKNAFARQREKMAPTTPRAGTAKLVASSQALSSSLTAACFQGPSRSLP